MISYPLSLISIGLSFKLHEICVRFALESAEQCRIKSPPISPSSTASIVGAFETSSLAKFASTGSNPSENTLQKYSSFCSEAATVSLEENPTTSLVVFFIQTYVGLGFESARQVNDTSSPGAAKTFLGSSIISGPYSTSRITDDSVSPTAFLSLQETLAWLKYFDMLVMPNFRDSSLNNCCPFMYHL